LTSTLGLDQVERRVVLEDRHQVNRLQRRQHAGARVDILDRAVGALEPLDRGIAVEADHQPVAYGARASHRQAGFSAPFVSGTG
jgi:hypothetical protein